MQERAIATERAAPSEHWIATELHDVRLAAQVEANRAYEAWCDQPGARAYVVYRAAQDRADAAQEHLAQWLACSRNG
jgi:hypothetical protein